MPAPVQGPRPPGLVVREATAPASPFDVIDNSRPAETPSQPPAEADRYSVQNVHSPSARYFVITSNTRENVVKSIRHSVWATQKKNERQLDEAFRTAPAVILIFSVNRSEAFQGYARMQSFIGEAQLLGSGHFDPFNGFGRLFDLEWLRLHDLPYQEVHDLRNPLMEDRPVQFSRDGQELGNAVGRRLCQLIDRHIDDPESFPKQPEAWQRHSPPRAPSLPVVAAVASPGNLLPGMVHPGPGIFPAVKDDDSCSSGSVSRRRRRKRRRQERKLRQPPHPMTSSFDEQLQYFLSLDYDDYVEWWKVYGAVSPGPTPPPDKLLPGQKSVVMLPPPPPIARPPPGAHMPFHFYPPPIAHHMVPPHMMPPHMVPHHMAPHLLGPHMHQ